MIQVNDLSKSYGPQEIFESASFLLSAGERVGLVGRNGSGKSTLFRMILGLESADAGEITLPKNYRIGTLEQHISFRHPTVLLECASVLVGEAQYDHYKAEKILFGLGFTAEDMNRDPHTFSGGYQIRINLAKVLLTEPNLLLLDEPTNYLDIISLRWLRNFLNNFQGEVIIITHDREFMNSVTTHTMGIVRRKIKKLKGDTTKYFEQLAQEEEIYEKTKANQDRRIKELSAFVERFRYKATKATQAQSRLKMLEKMGQMDELEREQLLGFRFNHAECPGKVLMQVEDLSFAYPGGQKLIDSLSFAVGRNDRIGIIGKNGKGKSTLLNLLGGVLTPSQGVVRTHPGILRGHFGQTNIERLSMNATVEEEIASEHADLPYSRIRGICGTMMFEGEMAKKKISVLSGGERSRVMLGKIIAKPTNLLLLDEPTNHLDMESIESLCDEIEDYGGAALIVTHSEMLLDRLVNKLVIFHHGNVEFFEGTYREFLQKIGWEEEKTNLVEEKKDSSPKISLKDAKKMRQDIILERSRQLKPLKERITYIEARITTLEQQIARSNQELIDASEKSEGHRIASLSKIIADSEKEIDDLFFELAEKSELVETQEKLFQERLDQLPS